MLPLGAARIGTSERGTQQRMWRVRTAKGSTSAQENSRCTVMSTAQEDLITPLSRCPCEVRWMCGRTCMYVSIYEFVFEVQHLSSPNRRTNKTSEPNHYSAAVRADHEL